MSLSPISACCNSTLRTRSKILASAEATIFSLLFHPASSLGSEIRIASFKTSVRLRRNHDLSTHDQKTCCCRREIRTQEPQLKHRSKKKTTNSDEQNGSPQVISKLTMMRKDI